jgi:hypothetical protein
LEAASGGNPYFAIELARSLAERDIPLGPGEPLPVPGTLRALLGVRLADLAPETHGVTLAASALARPTVALVEASVRSVDPSAALAAAVDAGCSSSIAIACVSAPSHCLRRLPTRMQPSNAHSAPYR